MNPRDPQVVDAACPIGSNSAIVGELVRGLLQGRHYYAPDGTRLETVDQIIACLREHRRVVDRSA